MHIVPLFLASELVRYIISDYQAVVAVLYVDVRAAVALGLAIGSVPRAIDLLLSCIGDLFGHTTAIARGIWLMVAAISNIITKAMTKFSLRMIYQVLAVLGLVILSTNITMAAILVATVSAMAYQNITAITVFVTVLWMAVPAIYVWCRHLLPGYVIPTVAITAVAFVYEGYITILSYPWLWVILVLCRLSLY